MMYSINCHPHLGTQERCPNCNQFHLRPGYCQALNPVNAHLYPSVTHSVTSTSSVTSSVTETDEDRKRRMTRERVKRMRAKAT